MILIIDADSMVHRIAYLVDQEPLMGSLDGSAQAPPEKGMGDSRIKARINNQLKMFKRYTVKHYGQPYKNYEFHLTASARFDNYFKVKYDRITKPCFRYAIAEKHLPKAYKHNRVQDDKIFLEHVYDIMLNQFNSEAHDILEADDTVIAKAKYYKSKDRSCVIAAIDKDVLNQYPGEHFNWGSKTIHTTSPRTAMFFPYFQAITGDTADGYEGIKGLGEVKAQAYINSQMTEQELWQGVLEAYDNHGLSEERAIATMRIAHCGQATYDGSKYDLKLWEPPV